MFLPCVECGHMIVVLFVWLLFRLWGCCFCLCVECVDVIVVLFVWLLFCLCVWVLISPVYRMWPWGCYLVCVVIVLFVHVDTCILLMEAHGGFFLGS